MIRRLNDAWNHAAGNVVRAAFATAALVMAAAPTPAAVAGRPDRAKIVLGWTQGADLLGVRWHAMTHIAYTFVNFTATASLTGVSSFQTRDAALLPGGAAEANGVKVLMALANANFDETILDAVFQSPSLRGTLISNVMAEVTNPSTGCDGINLDLEFSWGTTTRDGMMQFIRDLRTSCTAAGKELSIYTTPSWSATRYDAVTLRDHVDFVAYSGYDFGTGNVSSNTGRYGNPSSFSIVGNLDDYIAAGIPADHLVLALPLYSASWEYPTGTGSYGAASVLSGRGADSFGIANYETIWRNPPFTKNPSTPADHQGNWYAKPKAGTGGVTETLTTFDDARTLEAKMRLAKAWAGSNSRGKELAGVAFWSLAWLTETTSVDPNAVGTGNQSFTRTACQPYQMMEELFAPTGIAEYRAETFEGPTINARWRVPTDGPDEVNVSAGSRAMAAAPSGAPASSTRVAAVSATFSAAAGRYLFKHQILLPSGATALSNGLDLGGSLVLVDSTTSFGADVHVPAGYAGASIRMVVRDGNGQFERGPAFPLTTSGWRRVAFDLTDAASVSAYTTAEGSGSTGNGVIDTAGSGARDIAFVGFEVTNGTFTGATTVNIDRISYRPAYPAGATYRINEFRYAASASQFVEVSGPAGATMPAGLVLRFLDGSTGAISGSPVAMGGLTVPANGLFLVGASGLSGIRNLAMTDGSIPGTTPAALQLFDTATGTVLDAVVIEAFGGVGLLSSPGNPVVTDRGPGWFGGVAGGTNAAGTAYSAGRYPDGADTGVESADFSVMPATPGQPNGATVPVPVTYDFSTNPADAWMTFNAFNATAMPSGGVPAAPGDVVSPRSHRAIDPTGGGSVTYFGDKRLGSAGGRIDVRGKVFVPSNATAAHAIGFGFCAAGGSNFFGATADAGYDSGYWLIYENAAGVGLADGQADHAGTWQFVLADNQGIAGQPATTLLGSASLAATGATAGAWTTFRLSINPTGGGSEKLRAEINGSAVYAGAIPAGGPTSGAVQIGFRENHAGGPSATEGTWIDDLAFGTSYVPAAMSEFAVE